MRRVRINWGADAVLVASCIVWGLVAKALVVPMWKRVLGHTLIGDVLARLGVNDFERGTAAPTPARALSCE